MKDFKQKNKDDEMLEKPVNTKRRAVARAGVVTPLIMSLMNKTALGGVYQCSISGAQSGNVSSHSNNTSVCNVGYSASSWKSNADQTSGNGNINDWLTAGEIPFDTRGAASSDGDNDSDSSSGSSSQEIEKEPGNWVSNSAIFQKIKAYTNSDQNLATRFSDVFGSGTGTLWEVLSAGTVASDAVADYLNAKINAVDNRFSPVYDTITPTDIINLYQLYNGDISSFTTSSGVVIDNTFNVANYLILIKQ